MSDVMAVETGGEPVSVPFTPPTEADNTPTNISEAARQLSSWRAKQREPQEPKSEAPAAPDAAAAEQPESEAQANDAAPPVEATGETQATDPVEEQPLDLPRSWSKEKEAVWTKLDRATQQFLLEHDSEVSKGVRNAQNEAAEQRKALEAERQQAEQLKRQYEAQLPMMEQLIQSQLYGEFSDIKTPEDASKLAKDDPLRYLQYTAKLQELQVWQKASQEAQQRQHQEVHTQLQNWAKSQDEEIEREFAKVPETERKALAQEAKRLLTDYGFTEQQLSELWGGSILRSAPLQRMMADAARYHIAKRTASKPVAKPVPPVQRPGVAQPKGPSEHVQALKDKFERTGDLKTAAALLAARRKSA